ncbi:D-sedoheptulose 7-phosphate isomerase [Bacteroidales bacterium OttesenSCG-928-B11]|nr:D-sedoheptulose 7-phosphate isomerase [Bacteroidales bacterium OttesenSCG-928-C03]MDL2312638.1 D-sedoheptulose 7-phosphate isomerase [Bacteroidales bacterium OttesenSCG-928-B11]MDL2326108.1 D-sedoheptulose 7-phosphate isomerase [Bacteroidales bacterium OttesenSCG-928-A14]
MRIEEIFQESISLKKRILEDKSLIDKIEKSAEVIVASLRAGGKIHFCGNGGSAADAQHLAAELTGRFYYDRPPLNGEALHCNTSFLTAVGNDYGFEHVYSRLLGASGKDGDVLVAISTSGNSENILLACEKAKSLGIKTIAFTGETGGKMKEIADILLNVPSLDTPRIQEIHILIGHVICELVEREMFPKA